MKKYTQSRMYTKGQSTERIWILELSTNEGYATEYYEFNTRAEAMKAFGISKWLVNNQHVKQDFESFEKYKKSDINFIALGLNIMKGIYKFQKWALK